MSDEVQKLVDAEAAINDLLSEIEAVQRTAASHARAQKSLDGVGDGLQALMSRLAELSTHAKSALSRLGELSMPEVLDRMAALRADVDELSLVVRREVETLSKGVLQASHASADSLRRIHSEAAGKNTELLESARTDLKASIESHFAASKRETASQIASMQAALGGQVVTSLDDGVARQDAALRGVANLIGEMVTNSQESLKQDLKVASDAALAGQQQALTETVERIQEATARRLEPLSNTIKREIDTVRMDNKALREEHERVRAASHRQFMILAVVLAVSFAASVACLARSFVARS